MAKKTGKIIIQNLELAKALRGFTPVFANTQDLNIIKRLELINKKLQGVDNEKLRSATSPMALTGKMKEILRMELALAVEIKNRNEDF